MENGKKRNEGIVLWKQWLKAQLGPIQIRFLVYIVDSALVLQNMEE